MIRNKLFRSLAALGVAAVISTLVGCGASGAFGSSPSEFPPMKAPEAKRSTAPAPTAAPQEAEARGTSGLVAPDPNFEEALREAGLSTRGWKTDFSRHTVPFT